MPMGVASIIVLVATETGTAEMVADEIVDHIEDNSRYDAEVRMMDTVESAVFDERAVFLVCTSSTGQGELPHNGRALAESLENDRPDLAGVRYGIIGLGDSYYAATLGGGPRYLDELLQKLGANRIGEMCFHDRQSGRHPEDMALGWLDGWLGLIE